MVSAAMAVEPAKASTDKLSPHGLPVVRFSDSALRPVIVSATSDSRHRSARPIRIGRIGQVPLLSLFRIVFAGIFRHLARSSISISLFSMGAIIRERRSNVGPDHYLSLRGLECNADPCCNASAVHV